MTDLTITAVSPVKVVKQYTGPAHEAVAVGNAGYLVAATGKLGKADANGSAPVNEPEGVFIKAALQQNDSVTVVMEGWLDVGNALSALDYGAPVFLSRTAGGLADADEGDGILIGEVWPAWGNTTADKVLYVNPRTLADVAPNSITNTMLAGGFLKVSLVDGQDETSGPDLTYTLTGAAVGDEVAAVIHLSTKSSIATAAVLTGYTITDTDELSSGSAVDLSSDQLMVFWLDLT